MTNAEARAKANKESRIIIRIPLDASGDMDNLISSALIRRADQIHETAKRTRRRMNAGESIKKTRAEEEKQIAFNMERFEALSSFAQRGANNKTTRFTIFRPDIPRFYMGTKDLRRVLVRIELPLTDVEASPYQVKEDIESAILKRAGLLRAEALKVTKEPGKDYLEREAKSLLATRVMYVEANSTSYSEDNSFHYIKDSHNKNRTWMKYAGVQTEEEYLEKIK